MRQKSDPYQIVQYFIGSKILSSIMPQLNILCTSLIIVYFTKITIHLLFAVHMLWTLCVLQCTEFHRTGAIHISKRSVLYRSARIDYCCQTDSHLHLLADHFCQRVT